MPICSCDSCCCCVRVNNKVVPFTSFDDNINYRVLEIQPGRRICIHYFNPCPRNKDFDQQMQILLSENREGAIFRSEVLPKYTAVKSESNNKPSVNNAQLSSKHSRKAPGKTKQDNVQTSESTVPTTPGIVSPTQLTIVSEESFHPNNSSMNNGNIPLKSKESSEFVPLPDCTEKVKHPNKVIFFIHGVGGSADVWKGQSKYFSNKGYELIIPEWVGHGMCPSSKHSKDYYFYEILNDLTLVFDLHCKKTNIVIGHSYGSCFAAALARTRPRLVHKLVMISGGAPTPLAPQPGLFQFPTCLLICGKPILKGCFLQKAFYKSSKSVVAKGKAFDVPTYVIKNTMNGQRWPEGNAHYHRGISCPTLLIHGADDQLIPEDDELDMTDAIFGAVLHVIKEASHMVMMEKPEEVNRLIESLIADDCYQLNEHTLSQTEPTQYHIGSQLSVKSSHSHAPQDFENNPRHNINNQNESSPRKNVGGSKESTPVHSVTDSPLRTNRSDLKSAKSIPGRLFSARKR